MPALTGLSLTVSVGVFNRGYGALVGDTFATTASIAGAPVNNGLTGSTFQATLQADQAAVLAGAGFYVSPELTAQANNQAFLTGYGFRAELLATVIGRSNTALVGGGFAVSPQLFGAATAIGRGFSAKLQGITSAKESAKLIGATFETAFTAAAVGFISAKVTGGTFRAAIGHQAQLVASAFAVYPQLSAKIGGDITDAFTLNILTGDSTRYDNFPFSGIIRVDGKYFGVASDGLYLLDGDTDDGDPIQHFAITKDDDFGTMQSKNIPYMYLGCDDVDATVTPIVDDIEYSAYPVDFGGRRAKLPRGAKGRYWRMKISAFTKLHSLETKEIDLARKVK